LAYENTKNPNPGVYIRHKMKPRRTVT